MHWPPPIRRWTREGLALARDVAEDLLGDADGAASEASRERFLAELTRLVSEGDSDEFFALAESLAPDELWALLESLGDAVEPENWDRVAEALTDLTAAREERERLAHPSAWRRALAVKRLGLLRHEPSREAIRRALERGPAPVTFAAAAALARFGDFDALRWLLEHPEATSTRRRFQLVALLRRFGPGAAPIVRDALRGWEATAPIHLAAIELLGHFPEAQSVSLLTETLKSGGAEARVAAARALGGLGDLAPPLALQQALDDPEWTVRAQAARSVGAIRYWPALAYLANLVQHDTEWWVRRHAAVALGDMGDLGRDQLRQVAEQGDPLAREIALEVLEAPPSDPERAGGHSHVA